MKKSLILTICILLTCASVFAQQIKEYAAAKSITKQWLQAWDKSDSTTMKRLSIASTEPVDLLCLINGHSNEPSMTLWGDTKSWHIKKDTVEKIEGYMITAYAPNGDNLPLFLQKDHNNNWVVNIYLSCFEFCDQCSADLKKNEYGKNYLKKVKNNIGIKNQEKNVRRYYSS